MRLFGKVMIMALVAGLALPVVAGTDQSPQEAAARELVEVAGGKTMMESGADAMMATLRQNPNLAPYEDVIRAWYRKIFAEGDFEGELAAIYAKHFSEDEIRGLIAFYKTPLGRKTITILPQIMKEGAELGMKRAQEHQAELIQMLNEAKAEREAKDKPPKP